MSQPKHYKLYHHNFLELNLRLNSREILVYLYLASKFPFCDSKMEIDTSLIAEELGYHRRTIQLAIQKLVAEKLIDIEITKFRYSLAKHGCNSIATGSKNTSVTRESIDRQGESIDRQGESIDRQGESIDRQLVLEPAPDKDSGTPQTIQTFTDYSDSLSEEEPKLTVESTKVVGGENEEREREDFSIEEEEVIEKDKILDPSTSLSKEEEPKPKAKDLSSGGKGFAPCNTTNDKRVKTIMPRTFKKLKRDFGYSEADCREFEEFVQKKVAHFNPPIANYDDYLRSRLQGLVNDFDKSRAKKAESKRVSYVVIEPEDIPKKEPIERSKSVKQIMAEIQEQKLKEKEQQQNG